jgi:hypothetical protein
MSEGCLNLANISVLHLAGDMSGIIATGDDTRLRFDSFAGPCFCDHLSACGFILVSKSGVGVPTFCRVTLPAAFADSGGCEPGRGATGPR